MNRKTVQFAAFPLLAFAVTLILYLVCYALYDIFPCGENTIVWCDMEQQAVPLLVQLRQIAKSGESIRYTVLDAGGMQFYGVFFFFLSNPFSLLALVTDIPANQLVGLLVILKLALSAGTAALWLRFRVPMLRGGMQVLLGVMYGCCGYGLFYYQNLMWLDVMAMLPLLMIAMRYLLKREKALPYFLALSATMLLCFYLCYMVVLFVLIYMTVSVRFTVRKERRGIVALRFWLASMLAACATAFVWLPCYLQVRHSARTGGIIDTLLNSELFHSLYDKLTLLSCTAICFAVLPLLLRKKRRRTNAGKRDLALCGLLGAAVLLDPVNEMWHTGSYQAFPMRWGMIPVLLLLTVAAQELTGIEKHRRPRRGRRSRLTAAAVLTLLPAGMAGICLILHRYARRLLVSYSHSLWISGINGRIALVLALLFAMSYGIVLHQYHARRLSARICTVGCALLFLCEFPMHFDLYPGESANADPLFAQTMQAEQAVPEHDSLARIRLTKKYAHANMLGALGIPTMAHYTSLTRADYLSGVKRFGYSSYWMEVTSTGGTVLSDMLWNVRYQLGQTPDFPSWTARIWSDDRRLFSAAESRLTLPPALYSDAAPQDIAELPSGSRIGVQRVLAERMLGAGDAVTEYAPARFSGAELTQEPDGTLTCRRTAEDGICEIVYLFYVKGHQALYFDLYSQTGTELGNPRYGAVSVLTARRAAAENYPGKQNNGIVFLGEATDELFTVRVQVQHDFNCESFGVFGLDLDRLTAAADAAEGPALTYRRGCYTAQYHTDAPKTLVLSVAYDEGLRAEIGGKRVPVYRVNGCQTAVEVPAGTGTVTLRFAVQGLRAALLTALLGAAAAAVLLLLRRKPAAVKPAAHCAELLMQALWYVLLLLIYCFPLLLSAFGSVWAQ
ncbi:MAG: YfhO family protein [Oscillospiraceae bacterium]|nr:YfhO family protein [Oscillospiraceae bacterium]